VGKTRLALQAARALMLKPRFPDGAWIVELAPLTDGRRLAQATATVFGLFEEPGRTYAEVVADALRPRRLALLLDNCEHLLSASAVFVQDLLRACPHLVILCTSREPLGIEGESTRDVPSLRCPDPQAIPPLNQLRHYEAISLFVERASAAHSTFELTAANSRAVAHICAHLDGIPLALELAAARARGLSVEQIADRLDDRFRLLGAPRRGATPRHQTLEAAVAWSYELLTDDDQRLLRRVSVFAGGWSLQDVEAVCAGDFDPTDVMADRLARLVDKSLLLAEHGPTGSQWYRQLETIRQFGAERLRDSGEERVVRERHLRAYVALAEAADQTVRWAKDLPWATRAAELLRLAWEYPNLRAAYRWALESNNVEAGLRLSSALFVFFWTTGYLSEGRDWLATFLERSKGDPLGPVRAWAISVAAKLAGHHGDDAASASLAAEHLALPALLRTGPGDA